MFYRILSNNLKVNLAFPCHTDSLFTLVKNSQTWRQLYMEWPGETISRNDIANFINSELLKLQQQTGLTSLIYYDDRLIGVMSLDHTSKESSHLKYWMDPKNNVSDILPLCIQEISDIAFQYSFVEKVEILVPDNDIHVNLPLHMKFQLVEKIKEDRKIDKQSSDKLRYHLYKNHVKNDKEYHF